MQELAFLLYNSGDIERAYNYINYAINDAIKFLRAREIVHFQRFGEGLRLAKDRMNEKNVYLVNPSFDQ